jgi:two-component system, LytTR family, sensor kinase
MKLKLLFTSRIFTISIHLILWLAWFFFPFLFIDSAEEGYRYFMKNGVLLFLLAGFFYTNSLILIPKLLLKRKIWIYIAALLGCFILISVMHYLWGFILNDLGLRSGRHPMTDRLYYPIFPALLVYGLSSAIRITNEWFKNDKQKKEMENEKLTSELAFLKSQVNPHFLFNILNNICSLARKKSDDTENALIKLSQIMRYMLYESKDEKVSLEKEVDYLQSYIELQRLRISDKVIIKFSITGSPERLMIEPLLLIPFVENAFKHGISYLEESIVNILLIVKEKELTFQVDNSIAMKRDAAIQIDSGIGLKNVRRRLDLLYPGKYTLLVNDNGAVYKIDLNIKFGI